MNLCNEHAGQNGTGQCLLHDAEIRQSLTYTSDSHTAIRLHLHKEEESLQCEPQ